MSFDRKNPDGTSVKSEEYWKRRAEWVSKQGFMDAKQKHDKLIEGYNTVLQDVEKDIATFMSQNKDIADAMKPVSHKDYLEHMDKWFKRLERVKAGSNDPRQVAECEKWLRLGNARFRRTRLDVLQASVQGQIQSFNLDFSDYMAEELKDTYFETFSRKTFTLQKGTGYGTLYNKPDKQLVEEAVFHPWAEDGTMWSERLWEYAEEEAKTLTKAVRSAVVTSVATGKYPSRLAKDIVGFGNPSLKKSTIKRNASRLLQTEVAHVMQEASAKASEDFGITHYRYLATLDERTSTPCQGLDGKRFAYKDRQAGVNFAPMHPNCRSTHYDEVPDALYDKRASRGTSGKTVHEVPWYCTYKQWKHWQDTGKKTWRKPPTRGKAKEHITAKNKRLDDIKTIMDNNDFLKIQHQGELHEIAQQWTDKQANLYAKMSKHFKNNTYYKRGTGYYQPSLRQVHMDLDENTWEARNKQKWTASWSTKIHEEFHQLDHIIGTQEELNGKSIMGARPRLTDPFSPTGKLLAEAINDDVLDMFNTAIEESNKHQGTSIKPLKSLGRIHNEAYTAMYHYIRGFDKNQISTVTDALGLATKGKISPHRWGLWGHDDTYNKDRGLAGATSETWASMGAHFMNPDPVVDNAVRHLMPKSWDTYYKLFEDVMEHAMDNDLDYK